MTTAATMTMCHHTLTWLSIATRLMPTMFRMSSTSMRMPIVRIWPVRKLSPNTAVVLS